MRFKKGLKIPIFVYSEEEIEKKNLGVAVNEDLEGSKQIEITIFALEIIEPSRIEPKNCYITVGDKVLGVPLTAVALVEVVENHIEEFGQI